jgi:hypothetical protein
MAEGELLDEGLRLQLRAELQAAEQAMHRQGRHHPCSLFNGF